MTDKKEAAEPVVLEMLEEDDEFEEFETQGKVTTFPRTLSSIFLLLMEQSIAHLNQRTRLWTCK